MLIHFLKKTLFASLFFLSALFVFASENMAYVSPYPQDVTKRSLSSLAEISVITFDSGKEIYRRFGHSAIRVSDPVKNIDKLFSFGVIKNIDSPAVFFRSLFAHPESIAGAVRFPDAMEYDRQTQNRDCIEQKLNISHEDKEKIYSYLLWKTEEQNRLEKYDTTKNNCATGVRDVLKLVWAIGIAENHFLRTSAAPLTSRKQILSRLEKNEWEKLSAALLIGTAGDRAVDILDMTFFPEVLRVVLSVSKTKNASAIVPFVKSTEVIAESSSEIIKAESAKKKCTLPFLPVSPKTIFFFAFVSVSFFTALQVAFLFVAKKIRQRHLFELTRVIDNLMFSFDILFFFLTGLIGAFILVLTIKERSGIFGGNLNFLWLLPTNIIAAFFCTTEKRSKIITAYFLSCAYISVFVLVFREKLPQTIDSAFSPIIATTIVRSAFLALSREVKAMLQARS